MTAIADPPEVQHPPKVQLSPNVQVHLRSTVFGILAEAYSNGDDEESDFIESLLEQRLGAKPRHLDHIGTSLASSLGVPSNEIGVVIELCNMSPGLGYSVALALSNNDAVREVASFAFRPDDPEEFVKKVVLSALEKSPGSASSYGKSSGPKKSNRPRVSSRCSRKPLTA